MFKNMVQLKKISVKDLCTVAVLVAITVILSYVSGFLRIGNLAKFNISFISIYMAGALFGPVISGTVAAMADVISYLANPTGPYVLIFTVFEFVNGFLFGLFLFRGSKNQMNILIFLSKIVICVLLQAFVNLVLRTYFLSEMYYGGKFYATFISRVPSNVIMIFGKTFIILALEPFVKNLKKSY